MILALLPCLHDLAKVANFNPGVHYVPSKLAFAFGPR